MAKHSCLLDATVLITANGAPSKSGWSTEIGESLAAASEGKRVRAERRSILRQWRPGHTWKARAAGEGLGSSWWAGQRTTPLGTLSPSPSYSCNPYFSSSAGCKSKFSRCKGDETEMILTFFPLALTKSFLAYAWGECCAQPLVLTATKGIHKPCISSWWGQNWLCQLADVHVLPANYAKYIFN